MPSKPKFAVRISRGLVAHWLDHPLETWEQADECRKAILDYLGEEGEILDYLGEEGEIEEVVLHV